MYYVLIEDGNEIVSIRETRPTQDDLEGLAEFWECGVYVIEGERNSQAASYFAPEPTEVPE
jgi:hypothetical protein